MHKIVVKSNNLLFFKLYGIIHTNGKISFFVYKITIVDNNLLSAIIGNGLVDNARRYLAAIAFKRFIDFFLFIFSAA